jgi:hypothetical protein
MKINDIYESTTAGSIATVAAPMSTQKRSGVGKGVYGNEPNDSMFKGQKTKKPYANSKVNESKMKELAMDMRNMDNGNFQKKYKRSKEQLKYVLGDPDAKKTVQEAHLEEDDVIIVPGQGRSRKTGLIKHGESRLDHEVEMARSDLFSAAKNAKQVYELIADVSEEEGLEGWVQEKIIKANDYLNTIREYLEGKQVNEMTDLEEESFGNKWVIKYWDKRPGNEPVEDIIYGTKEKAMSRLEKLPNTYAKALRPFDPVKDRRLEGKQPQNEMTGGVIAGGGVG